MKKLEFTLCTVVGKYYSIQLMTKLRRPNKIKPTNTHVTDFSNAIITTVVTVI